MKRRVVLIVVTVAAVAAGASGAAVIRTSGAEAAAAHKYTLHLGDKITVPAIRQVCWVEAEGGAPELFCSKQRRPRHQVTIFRDRILVWKVGDPDHPAWTGKP